MRTGRKLATPDPYDFSNRKGLSEMSINTLTTHSRSNKPRYDTIDMLVDSGGGPCTMFLPFSARAESFLREIAGLSKVFGCYLSDESTASATVRQALANGLVVKLDGTVLRGRS